MSRNSRPAQVLMEQLESRLMLAGNVIALMSGSGDLIIRGDNANNSVALTSTGVGEVTVAPGDADTTINGVAGPIDLTGLTDNVIIRLAGGDDILTMTGVSLPSVVRIIGGTGNNAIAIDSTTVSGSVIVTNSAGIQTFSLSNSSSIGEDLIIRNSRGDTTTTISNSSVFDMSISAKAGIATMNVTGATINGDLRFNSSRGNSVVTIDNTTIGNLFAFRNRGGIDTIDIINGTNAGSVRLLTGSGGSTINTAGLVTDSLTIQAGSGIDTLTLGTTTSTGTTSISTGAGNDLLTLDTMTALGNTRISTGAGNDTLTFVNSLSPNGFSGTVRISTGAGDDVISGTAAFSSTVLVNGGRGFDTLDFSASTFVIPERTIAVETIV